MHRRLLIVKGATLVELVIAIVIISIVLSVLFLLTSRTTQHSVDPMIQEQASAIGQAYLEEILQKGFCDPDRDLNLDGDNDPATNPPYCPTDCGGPVCQAGGCRNNGAATETSRALYDDICDYAGMSGPPADQNGTAIAALNQYQVSVQVLDDASVNLNGLAGNAGQAARIDVTVSHPAMDSDVIMSGYRVNF